jgi:hypothetical protein
MAAIAFLVNLDSDDELASRAPGASPRHGAAPWAAPARHRARMLTLAKAAGLVREGDYPVLGPHDEPPRGLAARAFSPTPAAHALAARLGLALAPALGPGLLERVTGRLFFAELVCASLEGARLVRTLAELEATLAAPISLEHQLLVLKRMFGFAGRGQVRVSREGLGAHERAWATRALARGPLLLEPWVERLADFALHGHVSGAGRVMVGQPTEQRVDEHGTWRETTLARAGALSARELGELEATTWRAGAELAAAGYEGPFGVDAFRFRDRGEARFRVPNEVNARYTMGWVTGMAGARPDLEDHPLEGPGR